MSKKRDLLISTALNLFYRYGINSIGINEVLNVSGVAKRTLYSHFESKEALALAALNKRHEIFMEWLEKQLENTTSDQEVIDELFISLGNWFNGNEAKLGDFRGCFFINTSAEFSDTQSDIARYCCHHKEQVRLLLQHKLSGDTPYLLDAICLLKEGAITTAYITGNGTDAINKTLQVLNHLK
jgi:AcrR family transcriptional regulator